MQSLADYVAQLGVMLNSCLVLYEIYRSNFGQLHLHGKAAFRELSLEGLLYRQEILSLALYH